MENWKILSTVPNFGNTNFQPLFLIFSIILLASIRSFTEGSLLHSMVAIAPAHASLQTTSLICVKNSMLHFCLQHLLSKILQ